VRLRLRLRLRLLPSSHTSQGMTASEHSSNLLLTAKGAQDSSAECSVKMPVYHAILQKHYQPEMQESLQASGDQVKYLRVGEEGISS